MYSSMGAAKYPGSLTSPSLPFSGNVSAVSNGAMTTTNAHKFFDAENPDLWLVGIGALTLGLIAVSTSVRIGPVRLAGSVGK